MNITLAILGRPNVGKSTLFNRLAGKRLAIVDDTPGVTRDRRMAPGKIGDINVNIIDTAGFEDVHDESLESRMRQQTNQAIEDAKAQEGGELTASELQAAFLSFNAGAGIRGVGSKKRKKKRKKKPKRFPGRR